MSKTTCIDQTRKCGYCKQHKPLSEFAPKGLHCRDCIKLYQRARREDRPGYVYLFRSSTGYYKIGIAKNVEQRRLQLHIPVVFEVECIFQFHVDDMTDIESYLHGVFASKSVANEWFVLDETDLTFIREFAS